MNTVSRNERNHGTYKLTQEDKEYIKSFAKDGVVSFSDYLKAMALLHEFSKELSAEQSTELDDIAGRLTSAAFNTGVRSGLKLGARVAVGLIGSDK